MVLNVWLTIPLPGAATCRPEVAVRHHRLLPVAQPEQAGELGIGAHRDQVAAARPSAAEHGDLTGRERHRGEEPTS
jgi:hypothetical protein